MKNIAKVLATEYPGSIVEQLDTFYGTFWCASEYNDALKAALKRVVLSSSCVVTIIISDYATIAFSDLLENLIDSKQDLAGKLIYCDENNKCANIFGKAFEPLLF